MPTSASKGSYPDSHVTKEAIDPITEGRCTMIFEIGVIPMNPSWPKALVNGHLLKLEELWLQWFHMVPHTPTMCVVNICVWGPIKKTLQQFWEL